jgi:hypothetical protein
MGESDTVFDPRPPWGAAELKEGDLVVDRYRVLGLIGGGKASVVYRVVHQALAKELALKVLRPEPSSSGVLEGFEERARFAADLDDVHLVRISDFGRTAANLPFLVMELVEGLPLTAWRAAHADAPLATILDVFDQILSGLEHAHAKGVGHGDLAENIVVCTRGGRPLVKILDISMRRMLAKDNAEDPRADLQIVGALLRQAIGGRTTPPLEAVIARMESSVDGERFPNAGEAREVLRSCRPADVAATIATRARRPRGRLFRLAGVLVAIGAAVSWIASSGTARKAKVEPYDDTSAAIESALAKRDVDKAGTTNTSQLAEMPEGARANLLAGHLAFSQGDRTSAASAYVRAIALDPAVAVDDRFVSNAKEILLKRGRGSRAADALADALAEKADERAVPLLAVTVEHAASASTRQRAYRGLERLGATDQIDRVSYLSRELEHIPKTERECPRRKWFVERLGASQDSRALPTLERQRPKSSGWFFDDDAKVNACMWRELERAIKTLKARTR